MNNIKVIIGANYGDEGKGVTTAYFAKKLSLENSDCKMLNILYNGGMQRGHTVNGFVFHTLGAATFYGADTYYDRNFMIDPIALQQELRHMSEFIVNHFNRIISPMFYAHPDCVLVTPYDVLINRALEHSRNIRHGSCGMGIYETFLRSQYAEYRVTVSDISSPLALYNKLRLIKDNYVPQRLTDLGISIPDINKTSIDDFMKCCWSLHTLVNVTSLKPLEELFDVFLFEGGQGLMLDMDNKDDYPHLTPSKTGLAYISDYINSTDSKNVDVEVVYAARSYLTRHGNGRLSNEVQPYDLDLYVSDLDVTNVPNEYQGNLRYASYGHLSSFHKRICHDFFQLKRPADLGVSVSWLDRTNDLIRLKDGKTAAPNTMLPKIDYVEPKLYTHAFEFINM